MSWALVFNPDVGRLQAVPLWSQVVGSLGGVTAWFRTARARENIMLSVFGIRLLLYVDDIFWASRGGRLPDGSTQAAWLAKCFRTVPTDLLGWELDPAKESIGPMLTLLGLEVEVSDDISKWRVSQRKRTERAESVNRAFEDSSLAPGEASKLCGRFAFLNSRICNGLGRALLWPLIWRRRERSSCVRLTPRLRCALIWFLRVLEFGICREINLIPEPCPRVVVL